MKLVKDFETLCPPKTCR